MAALALPPASDFRPDFPPNFGFFVLAGASFRGSAKEATWMAPLATLLRPMLKRPNFPKGLVLRTLEEEGLEEGLDVEWADDDEAARSAFLPATALPALS